MSEGSKEGWHFLGWYTEAEGGEKFTFTETYTIADDLDLYAHWEINTYTVSFVNNSYGTVEVVSVPATTVDWDGSVTFTLRQVTGYTQAAIMDYLTLTPDLKTNLTKNGDVFTLANIRQNVEIVLGALPINEYTVTVVKNAGVGYTLNGTSFTVEHGESVDVIATLDRAYDRSAAPSSSIEGSATLVGPAAGTNAYTYTVSSVTSNVTLTLGDATMNAYDITVNPGEGYTVTGPEAPLPVPHNDGHETRTVVLTLDEAYSESDTPAITVTGGEYETSREGNVITITLKDITDDFTVSVGSATKNTYAVTASAENDASECFASIAVVTTPVEHGSGTVIKVTLADAYSDAAAPAIRLTDATAGKAAVSGGVKSVVDGKTVYTYTVTNVVGKADFLISDVLKNKYEVVLDAANVGYVSVMTPASPAQVEYDGEVSVTLTLDEGFSNTTLDRLNIRVNGVRIDDASVTRNGRTLTFSVAGIRERTVIKIAEAEKNVYPVSFTTAEGELGYTVNITPASSVEHNGSVQVKITLDPAYDRSAIPALTLTDGTDGNATVTSNRNGSVIVYTVSYATGEIKLHLTAATKNVYTVTFNRGEGVMILESPSGVEYANGHQEHVVHGGTVSFTLARREGYSTDVEPAAYIGSTELHPDANGVYTVTITDDVVIRTNSLEFIRFIANFVNWDRSFLASYMVPKNQNAEYHGADPVRPATEWDTYTWTGGWECIDANGNPIPGKDLTDMTEDRIFRATYDVTHTLVWRYEDETGHWQECPGHPEETRTATVPHTYEIRYENVHPATCVAKGSWEKVEYCTVCGYEHTRTTEILDFDYTNHVTTDTYVLYGYPATCTTLGYEGDHYCVACRHFAYEGEYYAIDPNAHRWSSYTTVDDEHHSRVCELCGAVENSDHILREIYRVAATCVDDGETMYGCTVCGAQVTTVRHKTGEHLASDTYVENYVSGTCVVPAAWDEVVYCRICSKELSRVHRTGELGSHSYTCVVTVGDTVITDESQVTCGDTVVWTYTCSVCGDSYTEQLTVEHDWSDWAVVTPATATEDGLARRVCERCGEEETKTLEHTGEDPMGERQIQFIEADGVTYTMLAYGTNEEQTVSGYVKYYSTVDFRFKVKVNNGLNVVGYSVYVNGTPVQPDANGVYTVKAGVSTLHILAELQTPYEPDPGTGDNGGSGNNGGSGSSSGSCPYCHENHTGFFGAIVGFFHRILYFFSNLFK